MYLHVHTVYTVYCGLTYNRFGRDIQHFSDYQSQYYFKSNSSLKLPNKCYGVEVQYLPPRCSGG